MTNMIPYLLSAFCLAGLILTILFYRKYVENTFHALDTLLDQMYTKNTDLLSETTGESRISKLTHKARRITERSIAEARQNKGEKETIQGFISDMSHQMKTPLSGISMYTDLLLAGNLTKEEQQEFLSRIKSDTENLQWMMESLIKMSRLEVGAIQLCPADGNIRQTISDAVGSVIAAAAKKEISVTAVQIPDQMLYHDRKWTREAMVNILENAVKYSAPNSEIQVSVDPLPLYTKINITDHGPGIPKSDWHLIFKRFYRGENAKDQEGAGLGLYLASLIMERQGGYIMVDALPGSFTSFSLFLQNSKN